MNVYKIAWWMANSVDHDQTPHSAASDLGLRCLLRLFSLNTIIIYYLTQAMRYPIIQSIINRLYFPDYRLRFSLRFPTLVHEQKYKMQHCSRLLVHGWEILYFQLNPEEINDPKGSFKPLAQKPVVYFSVELEFFDVLVSSSHTLRVRVSLSILTGVVTPYKYFPDVSTWNIGVLS